MERRQEEKQGPKTKVGSRVTLNENLFIQRDFSVDAAVHPRHSLHSFEAIKFPPLHVIEVFIEAIERFGVIFKKLALF